jgi:hypothetical protein
MPTWQFQTHRNPDHTVPVPPDVAEQLSPDVTVHVVLMTGNSDDDANWQRLATEQFFQGYAPGDEIYDNLPPG